ncbi:efflux RND transporter periplasmic adaptor subunit [Brevundimonas sp.]|jgi:RND family efflux transporter MFP subunit|uniref:efflux RND transporter periplasmic adaptor subunit n=1 Tax=Brevundimonas sp. TaxID=1871086 RepID=UPI002E110882|nr:HlyD family efflux transporter periplasmic adaptor subunit [Brevundimonas sp.]
MSTSLRKRLSNLALPIAAGGLLIFAVSTVIQPARTRAQPPAAPATSPLDRSLSGVGTVEPESELISVATELSGVVTRVLVRPGEAVQAGQPLFVLDARAATAALAAAEADVEVARATLRQAEVALADERQRLSLFEAVDDPRALAVDELDRRRFAVRRAEAAVGAARAQVRSAEAAVRVRRTDLARLTVSAPIAGRVYRVDVRPGEFAAAGPAAQPLIALGADGRLHVRAEFDEADLGRLRTNGRAYGVLRGRSDVRAPLTFVRVEPQAVEKRALSGGSERVDTRVVEVLYAFDPVAHPAFLGQRMDVFVEAAPRPTGAAR